jgi:signal transduction histidine kinase
LGARRSREPEPQYAQTNVRLRGIFTIRRTTDRTPEAIELKIQHPSHIEVINHLADDPRFALPVSALANLRQRASDALVHIVGSVHSQQPGSAIVLRDDTGQIEVLSGQSLPCRIGESVEAVGYPEIVGTEWKLRAGLYRPCKVAPAPGSTEATPGLSSIHLAARVLALTAAEAERRYPVELAGVVTWAHPDAPFFFIQDSSGGIGILRGADPARTYQPGRSVVVRGVSGMGNFAPAVVAESIQKDGDMPLPRAESISLEHALTGRAEAQLVELAGLVRAIHRGSPWNRLELTTSAGDFFALLPAADTLPDVVGAVVRVRGVCAAETDAQRRLHGIRLWVRSPEDIQIEEPAPRDLFALPAESLAELGRFGAPQSSSRRVRLSGTVLAQLPGRWIQIQDGDISLRVLARDPATFAPGERIEAVGYLDRKGGRRVLREAVCRTAGTGRSPVPVSCAGNASAAPELDGRLVVAEGQLLNVIRAGGETRLDILAPGGVFAVVAEQPVAEGCKLHSDIAITGLMDVVYDEHGQPAGFHVRPRAASDVALLHSPSWFTARRLLGIAATLGLGVGLALLWVAALHRRVKQQTDQIREQMRREAHLEAELQRATRLESLGLLAGGIAHDFNNLLTVIIGNLSMVTLGSDLEPEAKGHVSAASRATLRARDLTQQLLTFAKGGSPVRTALSLAELVQEVADFVLRGTAVDCEFTYASDLWPAHVDKSQISQVVQNLVINAVQAMPQGGHIRIDLCNEEVAPNASRLLAPGRYLHMTIADTGSGIAPDVLPRIFDPYFTTKKTGNGIGLATVFSIVRKHGGHITVESTVGTGTTFHLHLPASDEPLGSAVPRQLTVDTATLSGRVLLMDDEPDIRRLAAQMMQHLGLEVHSVADGAAPRRAEYARALRDGRATTSSSSISPCPVAWAACRPSGSCARPTPKSAPSSPAATRRTRSWPPTASTVSAPSSRNRTGSTSSPARSAPSCATPPRRPTSTAPARFRDHGIETHAAPRSAPRTSFRQRGHAAVAGQQYVATDDRHLDSAIAIPHDNLQHPFAQWIILLAEHRHDELGQIDVGLASGILPPQRAHLSVHRHLPIGTHGAHIACHIHTARGVRHRVGQENQRPHLATHAQGIQPRRLWHFVQQRPAMGLPPRIRRDDHRRAEPVLHPAPLAILRLRGPRCRGRLLRRTGSRQRRTGGDDQT